MTGSSDRITSEHDVANVLKRFIRQLEEPLLTEQLRQDFLSVAVTEDQLEDEKLEKYRQLLNKLPAINYNTLRRLVSQSSHTKLVNLSHCSGGTSLHCCGSV